MISCIITGKVQTARYGVDHTNTRQTRQAYQLLDGGVIAPQITGNDEGPPRSRERSGHPFNAVRRQCSRRGGRPAITVDGYRVDLRLQDLTRRREVDRTLRITVRKLHRPMHQLADVLPCPDLIVIAHVATDDAALIEPILDPVNELVTAPFELSFLRRWRGAGENQYGHATLGGVVNGPAEGLGATVHVHHDALCTAGNLRKSVRGGQRHHLARARDHLRIAAASGRFRGDGLDERGMVAAQVREHVLDSAFAHRLEQCGACGLHDLLVGRTGGARRPGIPILAATDPTFTPSCGLAGRLRRKA